MFKYNTHVCLVSGQAAANFLPIIAKDFTPQKIILVVSEGMKESAKELTTAVKRAAPSTKIELKEFKNPNNLQECYELADRIVTEENPDLNVENLALNFTGGTKLMSMAFLQTFNSFGLDSFYLNVEDNNIIIVKDIKNKKQISEPIEVKPSIKNYLLAYGYEIDERLSTISSPILNTQEIRDFIDRIALKPSVYKNAIATLNYWATMAEEKKQLFWDNCEINDKALNCMIDDLVQTDLITFVKGKITFKNEESRFFLNGGWLEIYVLREIQKAGFKECAANIRLIKKADNEIDVAFLNNGHLNIIECKTCNMSQKTEVEKILDKLAVFQRFGGNTTKTYLVSFQKVNEKVKQNAVANKKVTIIDDDSIKNLISKIKNS